MEDAYIKIHDPNSEEAQSGLLKRAYRRIGGSHGNIAMVHQSQSLNPDAMMAHLDFYMALMYRDSPLSRIQRELLGTIVSETNNCEYCIIHHYETLLAHWPDAPRPDQLLHGKDLSDPILQW